MIIGNFYMINNSSILDKNLDALVTIRRESIGSDARTKVKRSNQAQIVKAALAVRILFVLLQILSNELVEAVARCRVQLPETDDERLGDHFFDYFVQQHNVIALVGRLKQINARSIVFVQLRVKLLLLLFVKQIAATSASIYVVHVLVTVSLLANSL